MRVVELLPHDPAWAGIAGLETRALQALLGDDLVAVHHIGSTAIPGIRAKPVIDLLLVVRSLDALEHQRAGVEALGYQWRGEHGLPGRRYCSKDDPLTGHRRVHAHAYAAGSPDIQRHLAFRDYLRANPRLAAEYDNEKALCRRLHPFDSRAYSERKGEWIRTMEARALAAMADAVTPGA